MPDNNIDTHWLTLRSLFTTMGLLFLVGLAAGVALLYRSMGGARGRKRKSPERELVVRHGKRYVKIRRKRSQTSETRSGRT
jgi:hypothetical protein